MSLCLLISPAFANNLSISNVSLTGWNTTTDTVTVEFDISWENSWRVETAPGNYDAVWVFLKVKKSGVWYHGMMKTAGLNPAGTDPGSDTDLEIVVSEDKVGAFIYRGSAGTGTVTSTDVKLTLDYAAAPLTAGDEDDLQVSVMGIEMVYIPFGSFEAGDTSSSYAFKRGSSDTDPWPVDSEGEIPVTNAASAGYYYTSGGNSGEDASGSEFTIPAAFPKGFGAFYLMKHEITQAQYRDFLNMVTSTQQGNRTATMTATKYVMSNTDTVSYRQGLYTADGTTVVCRLSGAGDGDGASDGQHAAMNYLSWMDLLAYTDWAGLRPMTELEYEKACRGSESAVSGEYAWGTTDLTQAQGPVVNSGAVNETATTTTGNGLAHYNGAGTDIEGPLRVGFAAGAATTRAQAGAGYYGNMNMSDNVSEQTVTVGNSTGRAFEGSHGNGILTEAGHADIEDWPGYSGGAVTGAAGSGSRIGTWSNSSTYMPVSYRYRAAQALATRTSDRGGRLARTPDVIFIETWEQLDDIRNNLDGNYMLVANLDRNSEGYDTYASSSANAGAGWSPLGNTTTPFTGTFNGGGYTIADLYTYRGYEYYYQSLFGRIAETGVVEFLVLKNFEINGFTYTGALAGYNLGVIRDCHALNVNINSTYSNRHSYGGLVGFNAGTVERCSVIGGTVDGDTGKSIGGLVGENDEGAEISQCFASASVVQTYADWYDVGGLVGLNDRATITNSYATGSVTAVGTSVGGLVGSNYKATTTYSYATGEPSGGGSVGGLIGGLTATSTVTDAYWDTDTSGTATSAAGTGKTTLQMQDAATFSTWDIEDVSTYTTETWSIVDGLDYPRLGWQGIWDYNYRMELTIDATKIDAELTDFPVLVKLTSTEMDFTHARADGHDIRFTDADGILLAYEVERWDSTSEVAEVWVKIPVIDDTTDTVFYMYYGKPLAGEAQNPAEVWSNDYVGVWHMADATSATVKDSTSYENHGTKKGADEPVEAAGKIGMAQSFDGSDDYFDLGTGFTHQGQAQITFSAWYKLASADLSDTAYLMNQRRGGFSGISLHLDNTEKMRIYVDTSVSGSVNNASTSSYQDTNWHYAVGTYDGTAVTIYMDGSPAAASSTAATGTIEINQGDSRPVCVGVASSGGLVCSELTPDFEGLIDHMSISSVGRSAAWVKAEYNSGNNTLLSYGAEEDMSWACGDDLAISHDDDDDVAPADASITYGTVLTDLTGSDKCWITRNLGATTQASSATDSTAASAGWYWQFNRKQGYSHDGSTLTPSWTVTSIDEDSDWTSDQDPCTLELGAGWRLPTSAEWTNADSNGSWGDYDDTYASVLKLHAAGGLDSSGGSLGGRGGGGGYWSSTQGSSTGGYNLNFNAIDSSVNSFNKAYGFSGRCLKD